MVATNSTLSKVRLCTFAMSALAAAALVACGGSSSDDDDNDGPTTSLSGVVASGAPLGGASVRVTDSDAATTDPAAVTAAADGSYTIDVSGLKAPFAVVANGTLDGGAVSLVAIVPSVSEGSGNTANVTSLTNAVAALVAPSGDPAALASATALAAVTTQNVGNATALVVNTLATDSAIASALGANFNPLTTVFSANGSGIDAVLDKLQVDVSSSGVAITNLAAPVSESATPAPVQLTQAQTATPTVVPTLAPSAPADALPTATELAALGKKYEDCLALPLAQRVTLDASGTVTAVSAACDYAVADFKTEGRNWVQSVGQFTLAKHQLDGAKVGKGLIVLTAAAANHTDPKVHKHPYCNTATCVVVRWPQTTASGKTVAGDWLLAKANGAWNFVGNQRPYRMFADARLNRRVNVNSAGPAAGNTSDPYFFKDRFESTLRLQFDLSVGDTSNVRALRVTGPGLPAAGVVLARSQRCGTEDRLAIINQAGSTRVNTAGAEFQFWTGGSAAEFLLDAANLDGSALAMPVPVRNTTTQSFQDISPAPVANQSSTMPAWSIYKFEIFGFAVLSDEPEQIVYLRTSTPAENAALGAGKAWPTLAQSVIDAYLKPTGASAGAVSSLATSFSWTDPAGSFVLGGSLFGQNFLTTTNAQGESANYALRTRLDVEPAAFGDTSAAGYQFAPVRSGTSLSSFTASAGTNPNPRCTSQAVVPLTDNISDYREVNLSLRGADRKLYNATWFWDN